MSPVGRSSENFHWLILGDKTLPNRAKSGTVHQQLEINN
jgi:hypothetical protein